MERESPKFAGVRLGALIVSTAKSVPGSSPEIGVLKSIRIADRDYHLPDLNGARVAKIRWREVGRADRQHSQVRTGIVPRDRCTEIHKDCRSRLPPARPEWSASRQNSLA